MTTQATSAEVWTAIQLAVQAAAGVPMVWSFQNFAQPATDYGRLSIGSFIATGWDYQLQNTLPDWTALTHYAVGDRVLNNSIKTYTCTIAGTSAASGGPTGTGTNIVDGTVHWDFVPAGQEVTIQIGGVQELPLQLEIWSAALVEQVSMVAALTRLNTLVTKLWLPGARDILKSVGVTPFDAGAVQWVPSVVSAGFRGRATCDVMCRIPSRALTEYAGFVASLTVNYNAGDGIAGTVRAP